MSEAQKFPLISGYLSLDLVNTEVVRRGQRHNLLLSEEDVFNWLSEMTEKSFLLDARLLIEDEKSIQQLLPRILEMRAVLRKNFELIADGESISEEFIVFLEKKIEKAPFIYKLIDQKLNPIPVGAIDDVLLSLIAFDVLRLIADSKLGALKRCSNPDCVLLFIDESGRRKWCSMKICGNRKKVARFQHRKSDHE